MKKKFLKPVAILLALFMISSIIAGCQKKEETTQTTASAGTQGAVQETVKEIPTYELNYVMWGNAEQLQGGQKPKYFDDVAAAINEKLSKDRGFKLKFNPIPYPMDALKEKFAAAIASGESIDWIKFNNDIQTYVISKGLANDITDWIKADGQSIYKWYPENVWNEVSNNGRIFAIPQVDFPFYAGAWIRQDWLDKASLQIPTNLAELENVMKVFRDSDFDGNGKADTVPASGGFYDYIVMYLLGAFTKHPGDYIEGDAVKSRFEDPGFKDTLALINRWYKEKYIDDLIFDVDNDSKVAAIMSQNKLGISLSSIWQLEWGPLNTVAKAVPDVNLKWMPVPKEVTAYPTNGIAPAYIFNPVTSKNSKIAVQFYDWIYEKEENFILTHEAMGIEGKTFVFGENNAPELPKAELDAGIKAGTLLCGPYKNTSMIQYGLKFLPAVTPAETRKAYADVTKNEVVEIMYVPATISLNSGMPENMAVKRNDAESVAKEYIQKVIQGKATYEEFITKWKEAGGADAFAEYNKIYQAAKK